MTATLVLSPGEVGDAAQAAALLASHGVVHGVDEDLIAGLPWLRGPLATPIAYGTAPEPGEPGRIELTFALAGRPTAAGRAAPGAAEALVHVVPGQLLARQIPARPGRPGQTTTGYLLRVPAPANPPLRAGVGVRLGDDGLGAFATAAGRPSLQGGVLLVHARCIHDRSVAPGATLRVEGDLVVLGNIGPQAVVEASGDVHVAGKVVGARVTAGGALDVAGAVERNAALAAGGDVQVDRLTASSVHAGGALAVRGDVVRATVEARGLVSVGGAIIGGHVAGHAGVEARAVGNGRGVATRVQTAAAPPTAEARQGLARERVALQAALARLGADAAEAPALADRYQALADQERDLDLDQARRRPRVEVREALHAGVTLQLGPVVFHVLQPGAGGRFEQDGEVVRRLDQL
jgi:hypothetical protein